MKKFAICCLALLPLLTAGCCSAPQATAQADALETIMTRTSVRAYTDQPVDDATIEKILRAGMAAPSAVNKQPWAFVVIRTPEQMALLQEVHPRARMLASAQAAIIVCGDMERAIQGEMQSFWVQDASAATENILLAAHALGLGAVWTGVYPNTELAAQIARAFEMPSTVVPLCVIPMGYPAETPEPKDKWKPENVHFERW